MTLKEKIQHDMKQALFERAELRLSVLRMLLSAVHNREIEKRAKGDASGLTDDEVLVTIRSEMKKRRDAAAEFEKGGRHELAEKESAEGAILQNYLPQELSDEALENIVRSAVASAGSVTVKDFGRVMGEAMKKVKGQASGDRVSTLVKKFLEK